MMVIPVVKCFWRFSLPHLPTPCDLAPAPIGFRTLGGLPRVSVVQVSDVGASALLADKHCGEDVKLIYYLNGGELLSREINFKDTHSPRGDLLVVSERACARARAS